MSNARAAQHRIRSTVLVLLVFSGALACNREKPVSGTTAAPPQAATGSARDDSAIATNVRARFYTDDTVRARRIDVTAEGGVVTLRGAVENDAAKKHAVDIAQTVEGVVRVVDELTVTHLVSAEKPAGLADPATTGTAGHDAPLRLPAWITTKIQSQYFLSSKIKPWTVDVTTSSDGVVTLDGTVDTEQKKAEALRIARDTEGVKQVVDRITVHVDAAKVSHPVTSTIPEVGQPDPWITAKIQAKYFVDDDIKARNINVDTVNGRVTLYGTVGSEAERRQAVTIARNASGVKDVVDELRLQPNSGTPGNKAAATTSGATDDASDLWTTTKIQAKYFIDSEVKGQQIDVDTRGAVVTLTGTVDTAAQKTEAEQLARETEGVSRVVNQLTVRPSRNQ
jgi:osmotically-inducible protein OsmY